MVHICAPKHAKPQNCKKNFRGPFHAQCVLGTSPFSTPPRPDITQGQGHLDEGLHRRLPLHRGVHLEVRQHLLERLGRAGAGATANRLHRLHRNILSECSVKVFRKCCQFFQMIFENILTDGRIPERTFPFHWDKTKIFGQINNVSCQIHCFNIVIIPFLPTIFLAFFSMCSPTLFPPK